MKKIYYILTILIYIQSAPAQMGVNSTGQVPDTAAMRSTNKGFCYHDYKLLTEF